MKGTVLTCNRCGVLFVSEPTESGIHIQCDVCRYLARKAGAA